MPPAPDLDTAPQGGYDDDINKTTKGLIIMTTVSLIKETDTCSLCPATCAPAASIECDPLCTACAFTLLAETHLLPLTTPHELAFALRDPAAAMPINDYDFAADDDRPQSPRPLWW